MPVRRLTFIGDRDAPETLSAVYARRPILGTGERPPELEALASHQSFFIEAAGTKKPEVRVERAGKDETGIWRVDIPVDDQLRGAQPGLTMHRGEPDEILREVDEQLPFTGFRPDWTDALFAPRPAAPESPLTLTRFNGRRVTPHWVFGQDNRHQFRDRSWPWGLVGRITNNRGFSGTGALIGDRIVITAGHLVPWGDSPWWMQFVPAYYDGVSLHGAGVQSYVSNARGYNITDASGYDWALLRLYQPLGTWLGYFGYNGYSESWNDQPYWAVIGYPAAIAGTQRPSFQGGVTVGDVDADDNGGEELESDTADTSPGDSGGPMFGWWGTDSRVIGVYSGEEEITFPWSWDRDNLFVGGSGFTALIGWGRTHWT